MYSDISHVNMENDADNVENTRPSPIKDRSTSLCNSIYVDTSTSISTNCHSARNARSTPESPPLYKSYLDALSRSAHGADGDDDEFVKFYLENEDFSESPSNRPKLRTGMSEPCYSPTHSTSTTSPRNKRDASGRCLADFKGTDLHSVSYASYNLKGNFDLLLGKEIAVATKLAAQQSANSNSISLQESWKSIYSMLLTSQAVASKPVTIRNPNKAVLTIECPSTEILIANDVAFRLFGFGHDQLVGRRLIDLVSSGAKKFKLGPLVADRTFASGSTDELIPVYGKVIEILDSVGESVPVSLWIHPLSSQMSDSVTKLSDSSSSSILNDRWLAVLEPVERFSVTCTLGPQGRIFTCDDRVADLFGFNSSSELLGMNIKDLVQNLVFPTSKHDMLHFKQNLTGKFRCGTCFPVSVKIVPVFEENTDLLLKYETSFYVYTTISGLITILPNGNIHSCNSNFVATLFGYRQDQLIDKPIETIIPKFYLETMSAEDDEFYSPEPPPKFDQSSGGDCSFGLSDEMQMEEDLADLSLSKKKSMENGFATDVRRSSSTPMSHLKHSLRTYRTSSKNRSSEDDEFYQHPIRDGQFFGFAKHKDNSPIAISYKVARVVFKDGSVLFCLWIMRDPESQLNPHFNIGGSRRSSDAESEKIAQKLTEKPISKSKKNSIEVAPHNFEVESEQYEYIRGDYANAYYTLQQIGKGAFGCVKLAARKSDNLLVVTKFISKEAVLADAWVLDKKLGKVPIEISLLTTLKHPNIVQVLDVYENDKYYQVVMEKHGDGMDLFEFIDREPRMDEMLASYIFRQVVSAVSYLHGQKVLHRDLKDENVIIDENFECKLIDFGSAAFMNPTKLFSTFCGTMDYCSPEVLLGNKYAGPELEMWSLGILLYTLIFFENPFHSVEQTIAAELDLPHEVSEGLYNLVCWLLHPSPAYRATIKDVERHWWVTQKVDIKQYCFSEILPLKGSQDLSSSKNLLELLQMKMSPLMNNDLKAKSSPVLNSST